MKTIGLLETLRVDFKEGKDGMTAYDKKFKIESFIMVAYLLLLLISAAFAFPDGQDPIILFMFETIVWKRIFLFLLGYLFIFISFDSIRTHLWKSTDYGDDRYFIRWFQLFALIGWLIINIWMILGQSIAWLFKNFWPVMLFLVMLLVGCFGLLFIIMAMAFLQ